MDMHMFGYNLVFWLAFIALIVYLIVILKIKSNIKTPKDILDERLAKGEIDKDEYKSLLETLKGKENGKK
ncbi:SHOCT domain-containing protein [Nitrosophilus labii]|uniref:SHOCT domain-containing protein n=1 Tax=Nitrosophilus labii TaxID=2706014 RepID=UPI0018D9E8FB|nr:hypothetical protein [Nitrosophilus labii]